MVVVLRDHGASATVDPRKNDVVVETTSSDAAGRFVLAAADALLDDGVSIQFTTVHDR